MAEYSFPLLAPEDIFQFLSEMVPEVGIKLEDLKKPIAERVAKIYMAVFRLLQINLDWINQPSWTAAVSIESPEYFDQAIPFMNLLMFIHNFFKKIHIDNFYIRDLVDPKPKRTCRFLSALINYYRFAISKLPDYERIRDEVYEIGDRKRYLREQVNERINYINEKKKQLVSQQNQIENYQMRIEEASQHLEALKVKKDEIKEVSQRIKVKQAELIKRKENLSSKIQKQKEENERLSNKIVKSPDRMKYELDEQIKKSEDLLMEKQSCLERLKDVNEQTDTLKQTLTEVEHLNEIMTDIGEEIKKNEEMKRKLQVLGNKMFTSDQNVKKNEHMHLENENICKMKREKLMKLDAQYKLRHSSAVNQKEELQKQSKKIKDKIVQHEIDLINARKYKEEVAVGIEEIKQDVKAYENETSDKIHKVEKAWSSYQAKHEETLRCLIKQFNDVNTKQLQLD